MTACATRTCADERCGKQLPPGHEKPYCDTRCRKRTDSRRYARKHAKTGRTLRQPAFIRRLRQEVPEGQCVYCEGTLTTRQRFVCAKQACRDAYGADWYQEARQLKQGQPLEESPEASTAGECAAELRAGTARLALQLDSFRGGVREASANVERLCAHLEDLYGRLDEALAALPSGGAR